MGWPGIYSICFSQFEGDKDSSPLDEIFSAFIGIRFNKGYRRSSLFRIIFLLIGEIRLDLQDELLYCKLSYFP